jgi:hypothetical protein
MQLHSWHLNMFEVYKRTRGQPLYTVTMCLLESHGLLVSSRSSPSPTHARYAVVFAPVAQHILQGAVASPTCTC